MVDSLRDVARYDIELNDRRAKYVNAVAEGGIRVEKVLAKADFRRHHRAPHIGARPNVIASDEYHSHARHTEAKSLHRNPSGTEAVPVVKSIPNACQFWLL